MISIKEVAKLAEVSPATVSRVINDSANVNEDKVRRVKKVIEETGFKPNEVARSLYRKSARIIGVVVPNIDNPFFNEIAKAIEDEAYRNGYRLTLCSSNEDVEKERVNIDLFASMNADGIILMTNEEEIFKKVESSKIPVVVLDRETAHGNEVACVQSDNYTGGRLAMEHLLNCGCKRIVAMRGPRNISSGRQRFEGYLKVCGERGVIPAFVDCGYDFEVGQSKTEELLKKYPDVDGIIAANDMIAMAVYKVLTRAGKRVPEDIQLIGFDNIKLSQLMTPELTTVEQRIPDMGRQATRILLDHIEGKPVLRNNIFPVKLIERETTRGGKQK